MNYDKKMLSINLKIYTVRHFMLHLLWFVDIWLWKKRKPSQMRKIESMLIEKDILSE